MPPKYKPGGKRFPPRTTSRPFPKQVKNDNSDLASSAPPATSGLDQDAENRFELELCWCVQQLQTNLNSDNLQEKRVLEVNKTLNLLTSDTVSLIRKRQAMRNTFGDYRAKMEQDEKKHGKYISKAKISTPKDAKKFVFLKKVTADEKEKIDEIESGCAEENKNEKKNFVMSKEPSKVEFKFNFSPPE